MTSLRKNLAKNIRARRGNATQLAFARKLGIDQASVNRIELEEQNVTIDTLQHLCDRLKCTAEDLLDR